MTAVFIFVPAFGSQVTATTFLATHALMPALGSRGIGCSIATLSHPDIADLRNMALSVWFDSMPEFSHLLFIDADMGFAPELVIDMLAFGEPVVGAIYRKRTEQVQWAVSGLPVDQVQQRGGFMSVEGLGAGCLLIRRDAIQTMVDRIPDKVGDAGDHALRGLFGTGMVKRVLRFFDPIEGGPAGRVSEDISFCRRWRDCGGDVWGATHHSLTHVGPYAFQGGYAEWSKTQPRPPQIEIVSESAA